MTRYLPVTLLADGPPGGVGYAERQVRHVDAFPPGQHPEGSPIRADLTAVRVTVEGGAVRWFGCTRAYIDATLRMVLVGLNPRDEVQREWTRVRKVLPSRG